MEQSVYKMFPDEHFAVVKFKRGNFTIEEALRINTAYKNDKDYSAIQYLIIILKDCIPDFSPNELKEIAAIYSYAPQANNHICTVLVVDEPMATAFAHLFINANPDMGYYCSTIEKAHKLLSIPLTFERYLELIDSSFN